MDKERDLDTLTEEALIELIDIAKIAVRVFWREVSNKAKYPAIGVLTTIFEDKVDAVKRDIIHKIIVS